jgi:hypothetical protein
MERTSITLYQEAALYKSFEKHEFPVGMLRETMDGIIPKFDTQSDLFNNILGGGSLAFNVLVKELHSSGYFLIAASLNHRVKEYYRWIWLYGAGVV